MNRYGQRAEGTNIYICLKPEDHHPYAHPEMVVTGEVLGELLKRGESAYPDALGNYRRSPVDATNGIEEMYKHAKERLKDMDHFYPFTNEPRASAESPAIWQHPTPT